MKIEIDAKTVFGWIIEEYSNSLHHASLSLDCDTLLSQIPQVKMSHKQVHQYFGQKRSSSRSRYYVFDSPPCELMFAIVL